MGNNLLSRSDLLESDQKYRLVVYYPNDTLTREIHLLLVLAAACA